MTRSVYITAMEPQSGKSIVALGLLDLLSARAERVGFFRPIVPAGTRRDPDIELIRRRYDMPWPYEAMHALDAAEASALLASGGYGELEKRAVEAYRSLERDCDVVVCEGTDFTGAAPALDFELNADLANDLGCPVLAVVRGDSPETVAAAVRTARESLGQKGCELFGVMANRVPPAVLDDTRAGVAQLDGERPVYAIAEHPELSQPTVAEVAEALGARVAFDARGTLHREVRDVRVAAMSVEHFIEDLVDGTLVIVPGDRPDILVASLASTISPAFPAVAGVLLTAGHQVAPTVLGLLSEAPFPVLSVDTRTYVAATAVHHVQPVIAPDNERKIAAALGVFQAGVDAAELERRLAIERPGRMTPVRFEYELIERARQSRRHIVLAEGEDDRIVRAAEILLRRDVVELTVLGQPKDVRARASTLGLDLAGVEVVDPLTSPLRERYAARYHELRGHKGVTEDVARDALADSSYFGTMMVEAGDADGMVSGAVHTTADTIRPAFEVIRAREGVSVVSSVFFMCLADRVLVYGDCAVNPKPAVEQLADIAISSAETAAAFGIEPRVAMLSYSTGQSGKGEDVEAVRDATAIVRERRPELKVDGPIQYDAAVDAAVASLKLPDSEVAGRATVLVFPDLDTGNVAYKAVQRSANAVAIGPVLQGLRRPVNDLSRGCTVTDIVNTVVITAIQAAQAEAAAPAPAVAAPAGAAP